MSKKYTESGVDIAAGDEAVRRIAPWAKKTFRSGVMSNIGGFGALFKVDQNKYKNPVLVSGADGVGTKIKVAVDAGKLDTIGIDLVAMCVNDVLTLGAEPLFMLDYISCGKIVPEKIEQIVSGISFGCLKAGCALIGGETAEMSGTLGHDSFDIAGFCVGAVEQDKIVGGQHISEGDILIGLPSSGLHSNGYTLARKVLLETMKLKLDSKMSYDGSILVDELLKPTKIYVKQVLKVLEQFEVRGMVHVTGGGFGGNIPRILPDGLAADLSGDWLIPKIFDVIRENGKVDIEEMYSVFNMGIGFILIVSPADESGVLKIFEEQNEPAVSIGSIVKGDKTKIKGI